MVVDSIARCKDGSKWLLIV